MTSLSVSIAVHDEAWQAAMDRLAENVTRATREATDTAAHELAERTRRLLVSRGHPAGTKTPSAPGSPPASISGRLAASVHVAMEGDTAKVGPATEYARAQELGSWMQGHPFMVWLEDGRWHKSAGHHLPERPYLRPATLEFVASGTVTRIYYDAWLRAIQEVTR